MGEVFRDSMDAFLSPGERAIRRKVRDHFQSRGSVDGPDPSRAAGPLSPGRLLKSLGFAGEGGRPGSFESALVIEEVSALSPRLGRALARAAAGQAGTEAAAGELAWAVGSAAALLEACRGAAREKGLFQSTLMGHQRTQGDLAETFTAVQAVRLKAYRALRLIDRGERDRGDAELALAAGEAAAVHGRAVALAAALLGEGGLAEMMPEDERSRS